MTRHHMNKKTTEKQEPQLYWGKEDTTASLRELLEREPTEEEIEEAVHWVVKDISWSDFSEQVDSILRSRMQDLIEPLTEPKQKADLEYLKDTTKWPVTAEGFRYVCLCKDMADGKAYAFLMASNRLEVCMGNIFDGGNGSSVEFPSLEAIIRYGFYVD